MLTHCDRNSDGSKRRFTNATCPSPLPLIATYYGNCPIALWHTLDCSLSDWSHLIPIYNRLFQAADVPLVWVDLPIMADTLQRTMIINSLENPQIWFLFTYITRPWFTKQSSTTVQHSWCVLPDISAISHWSAVTIFTTSKYWVSAY